MIETGLRERKKAETRAAIGRAILHLSVARGLDAVTADEIAQAANVSVRTFHNYFGSKEDALVQAWTSAFRVHMEALAGRPAGEPILVALEHVLADITAGATRGAAADADDGDLLWVSLATAHHRSALLDEAIRMVTSVVAARTGTDPATDVYPHLVTAAAMSAAVTAAQFAAAGGSVTDTTHLLHECFALLREGLDRGEAVRP